jgi:hypothetical protein
MGEQCHSSYFCKSEIFSISANFSLDTAFP